ncbi:hypothetical protein HRR83_000046 [Exophiala dermatitidis]|uniref:N-acetyltransferase domain-containing protein n=2 Tax=Exophiala dermatitidis TaxID=5970 RepID=H6C857_EXODN|nr:uncharacterized protein HMPREF1120_08252 [Exophiala dermatitidis NIH/UT8656]KAJ4523399.1 hypothetical protein HRR73_002580 [Exophiala dermatitidis]EHY60284.1 hypothetical protein HMPREF1120_08252 [Exophiala dermatitidis NIH/UT8656]KAJ4527295.1 hypothetical protein HRR74_000047 [Exophiala dermatitidis]KAJ4530848.1 hypothetical protein HRR76_008542 [Exophiala dermatitidis]KAJ4558020.1 hypothetical protein HRR77_000047 [Exophiala dermatitidis]
MDGSQEQEQEQAQTKAQDQPKTDAEEFQQYRVKSTAYSLTASQVPRLLEAKLGPLMPCSLPLYRRIQFHLSRQQQPIFESSTTKVFVAVAADGDAEEDISRYDDDAEYIDKWLDENENRSPGPTTSSSSSAPWIAAYIDLEHYGQTQVWVFASWEDQRQYQNQNAPLAAESDQEDDDDVKHTATDTSHDPDPDPRHKSLMTALFNYIYTTLIPQMPTEPNDEWLVLKRTGKSLTLPYSRNKILFGTINTRLLQWIPEQARARIDDGYLKYVFTINNSNDNDKPPSSSSDPSSTSSSSTTCSSSSSCPSSSASNTSYSPLPPGYVFGPMRSEHLQTVLDRSVIPRTLRTLKQLPSVGVFIDPSSQPAESGSNRDPEAADSDSTARPVAWGFLGKDASLSSLHTEPEHRGKGLAASLARELLRRSAGTSTSTPMQTQTQTQTQTQPSLKIDQKHEHNNLNSSNRGGPGSAIYFAHSDVSVSNKQSRRVMEKLGGVPMWKVAWVEADLGVVLEGLGRS